jgi:hypothetical protein
MTGVPGARHADSGAYVNHGSFYFGECEFRGGDVPLIGGGSGNGGDGLTVSQNANVFIRARRTSIRGGNSHDVAVGGRGGYGVDVRNLTSQVYVDGQPFLGGLTLTTNVRSPAVQGTPPPLDRLLGALSVDKPLAGLGTQVMLGLEARPAEPHLLLVSGLARMQPINGLLEPLPIVGTPLWFPLVVLVPDGTGVATLPLGIPRDPSLSAQTLFVQGIGFGSGAQTLIIDSLTALTLR